MWRSREDKARVKAAGDHSRPFRKQERHGSDRLETVAGWRQVTAKAAFDSFAIHVAKAFWKAFAPRESPARIEDRRVSSR